MGLPGYPVRAPRGGPVLLHGRDVLRHVRYDDAARASLRTAPRLRLQDDGRHCVGAGHIPAWPASLRRRSFRPLRRTPDPVGELRFAVGGRHRVRLCRIVLGPSRSAGIHRRVARGVLERIPVLRQPDERGERRGNHRPFLGVRERGSDLRFGGGRSGSKRQLRGRLSADEWPLRGRPRCQCGDARPSPQGSAQHREGDHGAVTGSADLQDAASGRTGGVDEFNVFGAAGLHVFPPCSKRTSATTKRR